MDQTQDLKSVDESQSIKSRSWKFNPQCEPSSMPASCLTEVTEQENHAPSATGQTTLVSKGIVTIGDARALFDLYYQRLDHLIYQALGDHTSLDTVLESSPILAAAVCTVASLHSNQLGHLFEACMAELKNLVSSRSLSRDHNTDDIRGLCIGGFWLFGLSWAFAGSGAYLLRPIPRNFHANRY